MGYILGGSWMIRQGQDGRVRPQLCSYRPSLPEAWTFPEGCGYVSGSTAVPLDPRRQGLPAVVNYDNPRRPYKYIFEGGRLPYVDGLARAPWIAAPDGRNVRLYERDEYGADIVLLMYPDGKQVCAELFVCRLSDGDWW